MSATKRFLLILPSTVLACALLGGFAAPYLGVASAASDNAEVSDNLKQFSKVLSMVEQKYADKVDTEQAIYEGAIPNMLRVLDPHSQFFDPESFKQLRDDQRGQYAGVGMQIGPDPTQQHTVVIVPFPKTPAYKAGLRPRDIIAEVDGEPTDGAYELRGTDVRASFDFGTGGELLVRVGISAVDVDGARRNLDAEQGDRGFDELHRTATDVWADGRTGREVHNDYVVLQTRLHNDALRRAHPDDDFVLITRAAWPGVQADAIVWGGDIPGSEGFGAVNGAMTVPVVVARACAPAAIAALWAWSGGYGAPQTLMFGLTVLAFACYFAGLATARR